MLRLRIGANVCAEKSCAAYRYIYGQKGNVYRHAIWFDLTVSSHLQAWNTCNFTANVCRDEIICYWCGHQIRQILSDTVYLYISNMNLYLYRQQSLAAIARTTQTSQALLETAQSVVPMVYPCHQTVPHVTHGPVV